MRFVVGSLLTVAVWAVTVLAGANDPSRRDAYQRPGAAPSPAENASTDERVRLGRTLFFDPRLSKSGLISCATCHNPLFAWGDGRATATGHGGKPLTRRTPTILNAAWSEALMWDGRFDTLEEQALAPIHSPTEMAMPPEQLLATLRGIEEYGPLFDAAYPGEGVELNTVARALAAFQRTVISGDAPFDAWVRGDENAISAAAKRGFDLFEGKGRCAQCHSTWRFTDDSFHDIGVSGDDVGRGALFDDIEPLQHAFKTPTLRNADRRAPYMHDGSEKTLEDVIDFYDRGGRVQRPSLSNEIRPLGLDPNEKADLLAFLRTLTSVDPVVELPAAPR